jgi:hypothetical protein
VHGLIISLCSVPPNLQWEVDDLEEEWTFSYKFDYIHCMMMTGAFHDWPRFYEQAFQYVAVAAVFLPDADYRLTCLGLQVPQLGWLGRAARHRLSPQMRRRVTPFRLTPTSMEQPHDGSREAFRL